MTGKNYLHDELDKLVQRDVSTWDFLQKGSLDGVWYWDLERPDQEWMSPEFWLTLGVDPETKRHDPAEWQDLIFKEDLNVALKNFEAHCADPEHPYDQIVRYRHADGSTVWIRCRGLAIRDETGKPVRMLGAHTDITQVKRSEESAQAGWRAAEAANAELRSFAYSVSHDMKAPANTMGLLLAELDHHLGDTLDEEGRELMGMCTQTVSRMQNLVEFVLDYTRVIGMEPKFETVPLNEAVDYALQNLRAEIDESQAQISVDPLPQIRAVRGQMNMLFQNFISNAIKFCPDDRKPEVRITCGNGNYAQGLSITVADNGIGIPEASRERIFTLFQRLHRRDEIEGNGIGLPMCKHIALNHKGHIAVTSEVGKGSEFALNLPESALA